MGSKWSAQAAITDPSGGTVMMIDSGGDSKKITIANFVGSAGVFAGDSLDSDTGTLVITDDDNGYVKEESGLCHIYGRVQCSGTTPVGIYINLPFTVGGTTDASFTGVATLYGGTTAIDNAGALVVVADEGDATAYIYLQKTSGLVKLDKNDWAAGATEITFSLTYEVA